MGVLLSTYGPRRDVEPIAGLAVPRGTRRGGAGEQAAGLRGVAGPGRGAAGDGGVWR
jgi:hypothetical protein